MARSPPRLRTNSGIQQRDFHPINSQALQSKERWQSAEEIKSQTMADVLAGVKRESQIPPAEAPQAKSVVFSFRHMDKNNPKFGLQACAGDHGDWSDLFFDKVKDVCNLSLNEFMHPGVGNPKSRRSHPIDFSRTSEPNGFPILSDIWHDSSWQFQLERTKGRVAGFLTENIFNVVWLDPEHRLYPSMRREPVRTLASL